MARLKNSERARLPDTAFAYVDKRGRRKLPIHDEAHVRNALARFNRVKFEDEGARHLAQRRLLQAAKKFGIVPVGFIDGQLQKERLRTEPVFKELKEAQKIQSGLMPRKPPRLKNFALAGLCLPCRTVGGDWFDFVPLPNGRMAVVLADVSGKGMGAALLMSSTRSILRLVAREGRSPASVLAEVNRILVADLPIARFVTMIYAEIDPTLRTVTYANAGHLPPVLVQQGRAVSLRGTPELALGIREGTYTERTIEMSEGCRLFLYSDGVIEARNKAIEEYGESRLLRHAAREEATSQSLLDDVLRFAGDESLTDDVTIVTVDAVAQAVPDALGVR